MNATVKDVMTTQVVAVGRNASVKDVVARLRQFRVSGFPVIDDQCKVIGVVSESDLLAAEAIGLAREAVRARVSGTATPPPLDQSRQAHDLTAGDLMTHPAVTVDSGEPVEHAIQLMYNCRVKRLPVVDASGRLVGIVSRSDVLAADDRADSRNDTPRSGGLSPGTDLSDAHRFIGRSLTWIA